VLEEELESGDGDKDAGEETGEDAQSGEDADEETGEDADLDVDVDFEEEEKPNFRYTEYVITGVATDPLDINNSEGAVVFRSSSTEEHTLFVLPEAVDSDIYTQVYLTSRGRQ